MFVRTVCLALYVTASAWVQAAVPPKPKVVAIPAASIPRARPVEQSVPRKKATPAPKPRKKPVEPAPAVAAKPAEKPAEKPVEKPIEKPVEKPVQKPTETVANPTPSPAPRKPGPRSAASLAAYMPTVKLAFSARWGDAVTPLMKDFAQGNVSVLFKLDAAGAVTDFQVTQNTSNEAFAKFCEQFVRETPFEKPPEKALTAGQVEIPFTFWIY
jgi:TonB family protein